MSAREIIAEIEALSENEKAVVVQYVAKLEKTQSAAKEIRYASNEDFERVKQEVFSQHAPLLQKLAK